MVKRPLIWILCLFMIGIICNKYICSILFFIPIVFVTCLISFLFFYHLKQKYLKSSDFFILILPFILCLGYFLPKYYLLHNHLPEQCLETSETVQGTITNVIQKSSYREIYLSDVQIYHKNRPIALNQLLIQDTSGELAGIGDCITVKGEITEFERSTNPGQFDRRAYYEAKGICYTIWDGKILKRKPCKNQIYRILDRIKNTISQTYHKAFTKEDSSVLDAMVLGDKSGLPEELQQMYQKAGISHLLAISGVKTPNLVSP